MMVHVRIDCFDGTECTESMAIHVDNKGVFCVNVSGVSHRCAIAWASPYLDKNDVRIYEADVLTGVVRGDITMALFNEQDGWYTCRGQGKKTPLAANVYRARVRPVQGVPPLRTTPMHAYVLARIRWKKNGEVVPFDEIAHLWVDPAGSFYVVLEDEETQGACTVHWQSPYNDASGCTVYAGDVVTLSDGGKGRVECVHHGKDRGWWCALPDGTRVPLEDVNMCGFVRSDPRVGNEEKETEIC